MSVKTFQILVLLVFVFFGSGECRDLPSISFIMFFCFFGSGECRDLPNIGFMCFCWFLLVFEGVGPLSLWALGSIVLGYTLSNNY